MKTSNFLLFFTCLICFQNLTYSQFVGPAGTLNSTAIHKDSNIIVNWATGCTIERGLMDIAQPHLGFTSVGDAHSALGYADGSNVVSLGDGGYAILTFKHPIINGQGPDFAVYENAFNEKFLELAFVEVSSDGINYFRFPAISNTSSVVQMGPFDNTSDATLINNLAGKYKVNYGTPFDLDDLSDIDGLDINNITHVKIIDVIGTIDNQFASFDSNNQRINDPYPTAFASGGFDLDAVAVIHQNENILSIEELQDEITLYPNPIKAGQTIHITGLPDIDQVHIYNLEGKLIYSTTNNYFLPELSSGQYIITIQSKSTIIRTRLTVI